jgi:membrane protein DedA with SNARE-associated domain
MLQHQSCRMRRAAIALVVLAAISTLAFTVRSYRSLIILRSAYDVGLPQSSSVRPWMTLRYIAGTYHVAEESLIERLALAPETSPDLTLRSLADRAGKPMLQYVHDVQRSLADSIAAAPSADVPTSHGSFDWLRDDFLTALVRFGYPALALTLLLGAIGLPVPSGVSAAIAGSLAASGQLDWITVIAVGIAASVIGDMIGYGVGRRVGTDLIDRRGHWIGLSAARYKYIHGVFKRFGAIIIFMSRTLVSSLSSVVSIVAGIDAYRFWRFVVAAVLGRIVWTSSYVGLGYGVGASFEAAARFLGNLTGAIVSLLVLTGMVAMTWPRSGRSASEIAGDAQ